MFFILILIYIESDWSSERLENQESQEMKSGGCWEINSLIPHRAIVTIIGNLSTGVREPRTKTGSGMFPFWRGFAPYHEHEKVLLMAVA